MSEQKCHDCSYHTTCKQCLAEYQCGWCGNVDDPTFGICLPGDFTGKWMEVCVCVCVCDESTTMSVIFRGFIYHIVRIDNWRGVLKYLFIYLIFT